MTVLNWKRVSLFAVQTSFSSTEAQTRLTRTQRFIFYTAESPPFEIFCKFRYSISHALETYLLAQDLVVYYHAYRRHLRTLQGETSYLDVGFHLSSSNPSQESLRQQPHPAVHPVDALGSRVWR